MATETAVAEAKLREQEILTVDTITKTYLCLNAYTYQYTIDSKD